MFSFAGDRVRPPPWIASLSSDMHRNPNIPRLSSDMDANAPSGTPHPETGPAAAARPEDWTTSELSEALYRVLLALPELRLSLAERLGLNPSEVDAMEHLMGHPMGPVELSRHLRMTSASATVLVDRLEDAGHVVREHDPSDGRRRLVRPTAQGAQAVFAQIGPMVADLVAAERGLTARERAACVAYLGRVLDVLYAHTDRPADRPVT